MLADMNGSSPWAEGPGIGLIVSLVLLVLLAVLLFVFVFMQFGGTGAKASPINFSPAAGNAIHLN